MDLLVTRSAELLRSTFADYGHDPNAEQWAALRAIPETIMKMAHGLPSGAGRNTPGCTRALDKKVYVSSLDPGVGKTQAVIVSVRTLLSAPAEGMSHGGGVLLALQRKSQIEDFVRDAQLAPRDFAVLTADDAVNTLSSNSPNQARILITTHAMVERRCLESRKNGNQWFARVSAFHYKGQPRTVRVWDEALLPGRPLTLGRYKLMALFDPLSYRFRPLVKDLEALSDRLRTIPDGEIIFIEDLAEKHDVGIAEAHEVTRALNDPASVDALWSLFGKAVTVRKDNASGGEVVLDYTDDILPPDIKPLLVLDASARVRKT
jgi:hypothetical protein